MVSRQTVDVVRAVIYDGRAWAPGDPEPMVRGHFAASLTSSRLVFTDSWRRESNPPIIQDYSPETRFTISLPAKV